MQKRNKTQFEWILNPGQFMPDTWNINERAGNRLKVIKDTQLGRDVVQFSTEGKILGSRCWAMSESVGRKGVPCMETPVTDLMVSF